MTHSKRAPGYCIILAAGAGTRMRSPHLPKVCFPIAGVPAINRAIASYLDSGIRQPILVVGFAAEKVMQTVSQQFKGILYAFQPEQRGTAHAARVGIEALKTIGGQDDVLVVAGDRLIHPSVLEQLFEQYYAQAADLAFLTGPNPTEGEPAGRVLFHPDGSLLGNVEARDLHQRQILRDLRESCLRGVLYPREEILKRIRHHFTDRKAAVAFGPLWQALAEESRLPNRSEILAWIPLEKTRFTFTRPNGEPYTLLPEEVARSHVANLSVYLVKVSRLEYALNHLNRDNAQGEEYLSDMISIAAAEGWRVFPFYVEDATLAMSFNTPEELQIIEEVWQKRLSLPKKIADWQTALTTLQPGDLLHREFARLYNPDGVVLQSRLAGWRRLLEKAAVLWGAESQVALVRAPGRINLMGRHIDHQGGNCNLMTANREIMAILRRRSDDQIHLHNLDSQRYPSRQFSIGELSVRFPQTDWLELINSPEAWLLNREAAGDWAQYFRAAALRLQKAFPHKPLRGMDILVDGDLPPAAGLSSSSALVVLAAKALLASNHLQMADEDLVELCGEGEWFVGTRGGSADHAAIILGEKDRVLRVTFFDFAVERKAPFPKDLLLAVCDSGIQAKKTAGARDQFNHRVACYRLGLLWIKRYYPQYADKIRHLRDINTRTLGIPLSQVYRILLSLPQTADRQKLTEILAGEDLKPIFATHAPPADGSYPLRGVVLYGLAECERSRLFAAALQQKQYDTIGRLMKASHDGDRVVSHTQMGEVIPYHAPTSDNYLEGLIADLESGDPIRIERAQLHWQPGSYRCSLPEIDRLVDLALQVPGVIGAQLAGAGLGGSIMALVHREAAETLRHHLENRYYQPGNIPAGIFFCEPTAGSGVLFEQTIQKEEA